MKLAETGFLCALFLVQAASCSEQPNLIVILADDQGWGDLSFNGNTNLHTPQIDSLAQQGISFDRFFVCPVCSPTRAEFLTGRYHSRLGVTGTSSGNERLNLDEQTIGNIFKSSGYATGLFGKWHNGMQAPYHPNSRGFDEFYGFCSGHWGNYFDPLLEHNGKIIKGDGFLTDDITNQTIAFIKEHAKAAKPFFATLALNTPHSPMQTPDPFWDKFERAALPMRHREPDKEDPNFTRAALAMCENIDWNVGRILDTLSELRIENNTIVVYFSDNGPNSFRWNGDMKGRKGKLDEGGVRSPLFIRWPGRLSEKTVIHEISSVTDLLPTLADLCDIEINFLKRLDGHNLGPLIRGERTSSKFRYIVSQHQGRYSLRDQRFRLDNEGRLFDISADPGQRTNVADQYPDQTKRLQVQLEKITAEFPSEEINERPFTIAAPDVIWTQLPARDAIATGDIKRSNRYPNCSYFLNWNNTTDSISWNTEALSSGSYEAILYYACPQEDIGARLELEFQGEKTTRKVDTPHNPPLTGAEHDRVKRTESYVKEWATLSLGTIHIKKGSGLLILRALEIPGQQALEFRLLTLRRITS